MFPDLYESILRDWNSKLSREQWQSAFDGRWGSDEDYFGYALTDGGRIVGMLGMLFSRREINGRTRRFCNLHSWYVKPDYRTHSLALMRPALALADHTLTDFTPSAGVSAISRRLGFTPLASDLVVFPPIPSRGKGSDVELCALCNGEDARVLKMNLRDQLLYREHSQIDCGHVLITAGSAYCYIVYSRIAEQALPYCFIHYVSDNRMFAEHHAAIRDHLRRQGKSQFIAIEARQLQGVRVPFGFCTRAQDKLYRGVGDIEPHEIDTLYSEIMLFKHSPMPSLRERLAKLKNYVPSAVRRFVRARN